MSPLAIEPNLHRFKTLGSSNTQAKELVRTGAGEGTVVIAETQTAGRGREQRVWHSPQGGLYLSAVLRARDSKRVTDLAVLAGLGLAQAVKEILPKSAKVTVKWPNDVLVGWKKVGGVLCEVLGDPTHLCVVGIGLNVNLTESDLQLFQTNPFSATSFLVENGGAFPLDRALDVVLKKLFAVYRLYHQEGFQAIQFLWEKNCAFVGKKIEFRAGDGVKMVGIFEGIDENGALVLSNAGGERLTFVSGEITCYWL